MSERYKDMDGKHAIPYTARYIVPPMGTTERIAALEADVAKLQWQIAKLLAKPRKKKRK